MQGNVDVSFRLKGHKGQLSVILTFYGPDVILRLAGAGALYFTSVRKSKNEPFKICALASNILTHILYLLYSTVRFKVIGDDGTTVHIPDIS